MLLFLTSLYFSFFRLFFYRELGIICFDYLILGFLGQPLPLPSPSTSSSTSSQARWEDFDMGVLQEGWPVARDWGLESSIRSRVTYLENSDCVFLLDKPKGHFWDDVKGELEGCTTQEEYNQKVHFENRDLQVREQRHSSYTFWRHLLSEHPSLAQRAAYSPLETIKDFFDEERDSIDSENNGLTPSEIDMKEILFVQGVEEDLRNQGVNSVYIRRLLGYSAS